jgi:hypothetical protein
MLDILSYDELAAQVGTKFRVLDAAPELLEIELTAITDKQGNRQQEYFSLIFRGTRELILPQKIYQLEHEQLGAGALFLVPVGMTEQGVEYEAAFNRLIGEQQ